MLKKFFFFFWVMIAAVINYNPLAAQSLGNIARAKDTATTKSADGKNKTIVKLEDIKLPEEMLLRIQSLSKEAIENFTDEYQENIREKTKDGKEYDEYILIVKLRFYLDHIIGYKKLVYRVDPSQTKEKTIIDVPIEWCGTIDSTKESVCVESLDDIYAYQENKVKTSGWKQKVEAQLISNVKQGAAFSKPIVDTKANSKKGKFAAPPKAEKPSSSKKKQPLNKKGDEPPE